jgi:hypothetical protein
MKLTLEYTSGENVKYFNKIRKKIRPKNNQDIFFINQEDRIIMFSGQPNRILGQKLRSALD